MAESTKLILYFKTNDDKTVQYSYNHAKASATTTQVANLGAVMIANTGIYENALATLTRALIRTTTEAEYELPSSLTGRVIDGNPELSDETDDDTVTTVEQIPYKKTE